MANDRLRAEVAAELSWDPKVDGTDITVSVQGGTGDPARHSHPLPAKARGG